MTTVCRLCPGKLSNRPVWQASCARPRAIPLSCCSKELGHHFAVSCSEKGSLKAVTSWCRQHRHDPVDAQQEARKQVEPGANLLGIIQ